MEYNYGKNVGSKNECDVSADNNQYEINLK